MRSLRGFVLGSDSLGSEAPRRLGSTHGVAGYARTSPSRQLQHVLCALHSPHRAARGTAARRFRAVRAGGEPADAAMDGGRVGLRPSGAPLETRRPAATARRPQATRRVARGRMHIRGSAANSTPRRHRATIASQDPRGTIFGDDRGAGGGAVGSAVGGGGRCFDAGRGRCRFRSDRDALDVAFDGSGRVDERGGERTGG
jgi:hypothetical protein